MPSHLYRFRPLNCLLEQQIYFASPSQLNDPVGGFRDIVWQGDAVLWSNLFRHYVQCLERAWLLFAVCGEEYPIDWGSIPFLNRGDTGATPQRAAKLNGILDQVLGDVDIQPLFTSLAARKVPVRRTELAAILNTIHLWVVTIIHGVYQSLDTANGAPKEGELWGVLRQAATMAEQVVIIESQHEAGSDRVIPALFEAQAHMIAHLQFINIYNTETDGRKPNRNFVLMFFLRECVKQLECLDYPEWYAACFMRECKDPAIWGRYGRSLEGVCLIFKVDDDGGRRNLRLQRKVGAGSNGNIHGWAAHEFHSIAYDRKLDTVSFFKMLGDHSHAPSTKPRLVGVRRREWSADLASALT